LIGVLPRQEHRPVTTQPRSPSEHYRDAERLLTAAESSVTDSIQVNAALLAVAHAVLATVPPRRAPRREPAPPPRGGNPQHRWLYDDDDDENGDHQ
jgi:hypothetical protein